MAAAVFSALRNQPRGTDGTLLPSLPWTLFALTVALLPHLPYLPVWVSGAFVACAAWRWVIERRRGMLPATLVRAALALGCFLGVLATYDTISGVGPGSALLAVMASLKLLETRKRRDQFVLLFISIFLVMSSLLREQYLWSLPYLVAALVLIMAAWLRMAANPATGMRDSLAGSARLVAYAAPLALAMWFLFPRIATPFWAVPVDTSSGVTGLSDSMSPGDISELSQSDEVAFRVHFESDVPAPRNRYWRALVLHRFNGRTWTGREPSIGARAEQQIEFSGEPLRYQVTLEPTRQHWVPALELPASWDLSRTFMDTTQGLSRVMPVDQRVAYEVVSYTEYRAETDLRDFFRGWYRDLPADSNPRTAELAGRMRAAAGSDRAYIAAVLAQFREQAYYYTLQPPALGRNPVDEFLFETRRGFCEHYASAFTVMMRAAGIPARVVLGYQGGELNPLGNYLIVRQSDAHAWSEVWLPGAGWTRVDPTAAVAPERIDLGFTDSLFGGLGADWGGGTPMRWLHQVKLSWDALNANWNEWVLGYGPDKQKSFMQWLGLKSPNWRNLVLVLIATVVAQIIGISALMMWRNRAPRPDEAARLYRRFVRATGLTPAIGETPGAFERRAAAETALDEAALARVTQSYLRARYGGDAAAIRELSDAVAALR